MLAFCFVRFQPLGLNALVVFMFLMISACGGGNGGSSSDNGFHLSKAIPDDGSGSVSVGSTIDVEFNHKVAPETVSIGTFYLVDEHTHEKVKGKISVLVDGSTIRFDPDVLYFDRHYSVTIHHTITDINGAHLTDGGLSWSFFTEPRPPIFGHEPASNEVDVSEKVTIRIQLESSVSAASVNTQNISLRNEFDSVNTSVEAFGNEVTITPLSQLQTNTSYTVLLGTSILNLNNTPIFDTPYSWSFTTRKTVTNTQLFGTRNNDDPHVIVTDSNNNIYIAGQTDGIFPGQNRVGHYDGFVAKFNAQGEQQWVTQFGTELYDSVANLILTQNDELFVAGHSDQLSFNGTDNSFTDVTLFKLDAQGNASAPITTGSNDGHEFTRGMVRDAQGNFYIVGSTMGTVPGSVGNQGLHDIFIASFDSLGGFLWIKQYGTGADEIVDAVSIIGDQIYVSATIFDTSSGNNSVPNQPGDPVQPPFIFADPRVELFAFDLNGEKQWNKTFGTFKFYAINDMEVAPNGYLYVCGFVAVNDQLGLNNGFTILKLDSAGEIVSNYTLPGQQMFDSGEMAIDSAQNIYVSSIQFEEFIPPQDGVIGDPNVRGPKIKIIITKLSDDGTIVWSENIKAENHASVTDLKISANGNLIATGYTHGRFDGNAMIGTQDAFIFSMNSSGVVQ